MVNATASPAKKPKVMGEFEAVLLDRTLTPAERIERALAFDPTGRPGADQVRDRQKRIENQRTILHHRLDATFSRLPEGEGTLARQISPEGMRLVIDQARPVTSSREVRRALVASRHEPPDAARQHKSGDGKLLEEFREWYSAKLRPLYLYRLAVIYRDHHQRRGHGYGVIFKGARAFEAIVDLARLRASGWTKEAPETFDLTGIVLKEVTGTWYEEEMSMRALRGEATEVADLLPGGPLNPHEIWRDLTFAINIASPRALDLIPEDVRLLSLLSDVYFRSYGKAAEMQAYVAARLGIPKSHIRSIPAHDINTRQVQAADLEVEFTQGAGAPAAKTYHLYLIEGDRRRPLEVWASGQIATLRPGAVPHSFESYDEVRQTLETAEIPRDLGPELRLEIVEVAHTPHGEFKVTRPKAVTDKQETYEMTIALAGNFKALDAPAAGRK